jgi:ABC-type multidrug transport system ATPase subunit
VVLVTRQIGFLYDCDQVIILGDGGIKKMGTLKELEEEMRETKTIFHEQQSKQKEAVE